MSVPPKKLLQWMIKWIFEFIKRIVTHQKVKIFQIMMLFNCVYQYVHHRKWWSGFFDTLRLALFHYHHRKLSYDKQTMIASDGEKYTFWTPKQQQPFAPQYTDKKREHLWICAPGGMEPIDLGMTALHRLGVFKSSKICMFNNPGISNKVNKIPLPSPTNTEYLIEFIQYLQNKHNFEISLIGFSIGSVQVLRTLHTINNTQKYKHIRLRSVILVHGPDIVREAVNSCQNNWLIRMDVYFAFHIRRLQHSSCSWNIIKHEINRYWFEGWPFIKEVSVVSLKREWKECEEQMFNLRKFCDESIKNTPVLRIIAKNDFIVPFEAIDHAYFEYFEQVLITERGGHCAVNLSKKAVDVISKWNQNVVCNGANAK